MTSHRTLFAPVLTALFVLSAFFFAVGCQPSVQDNVFFVPEAERPLQWVEASFLSGRGGFSYTFTYNSYLLQLLDTPVENSAEFGPRFAVEGGAEIKGYTVQNSGEVDASPTKLPIIDIQIIGKYRVERSSLAVDDCTVQKAGTKFLDEGLVLELKLCPGDDEDRGEEALEALFAELRFEPL